VEGLLFNSQWWRDYDNNRLYLRTPDGTNPSTRRVEVKQRDWAFNLDNRSYITVQGFNLFGTSVTTDLEAGNGRGNGGNRSGSVAPANHIVLDGLNVEYVTHFTDQTGNLQTQWDQSSGVILSGSDNIIRNSTIGWSAGCGWSLSGSATKRSTTSSTTPTTPRPMAAGWVWACVPAPSASIWKSPTTRFTTRLSTASEFGALKNSTSDINDIRARIHHNVVHDTVLQSGDSGGLHTFESDGQWTRIDHNIVYNTGPDPDAYLYFGIYLDYAPKNGTAPARYVVDHNVVY
jgi:hypothetical protein